MDNYDFIPIDIFIDLLCEDSEENKDLKEKLEVLYFLRKYQTISKSNIDLVSRYNSIVKNLIQTLNYSARLKEKNILLKELELSKLKVKSNYISAKSDLLYKLDASISKNKKKLKYLEEDYSIRKNQIKQIKKAVESSNLKIKDLNDLKKECFNQINKITREFDESNQDSKKEEFSLSLENSSLSKSEKIKALRTQAKEYQYEINQLKSELDQIQIRFKDMNPKYEELKKNYQTLNNSIKEDEKLYKSIKLEIETNLKKEKNSNLSGISIDDLQITKSTNQIEADIKNVEIQLDLISKNHNFIEQKPSKKLLLLKNQLNELKEELFEKKDDIIIYTENNKIIKSIQKFRTLESMVCELERTLNKFLILINLTCYFRIISSETNDEYGIELSFIRSDKNSITFEELTTPEKTYFVILFFISCKIRLNSKFIIFTNLFIHNDFNKRGSIFRTIRKILPIFEKEEQLRKFHLIFIISNFDIKKPINSLKIINIEKE